LSRDRCGDRAGEVNEDGEAKEEGELKEDGDAGEA
jgi:hypothetical protein